MKKFLTLFCTLFLFFLTTVSQIKKTNQPQWITKTDFNFQPSIDENTIQDGVLTLLFEKQINDIQQKVFYRNVIKVTENAGVQSGSSINITYDPSYQKLEIHQINVIREGKKIEKLSLSDFQLIRKELNSESYIYDGSLSAICNLSDIRIHDIIEYSYSINGFNPIHKNKFSTNIYLNNTAPIGKIHFSILSKKDLNFNYLNTKLRIKKQLKKSVNYYTISNTNVKAYEFEDNVPASYIQFSALFVSEYKSWKEVVNWGVLVFNIQKKTSAPLLKKIKEIDHTYKTAGGKIKATLRFVQDEIRYLGLESGIGAYQPFSPNKVYKQRFGDCKDKSLLMVTMLEKMGIEAYPMLVNTYLKKTVTEIVPSPKIFDHCVVKVIHKNEGEFWYDPTISNQGGNFSTTFFPDYKYGLVLKKDNSEFDETLNFSNNAVEVTDNYFLEAVGKGATLKTTSVYLGSEAEAMRGYFQNNSINAIKKEFENYYSNYFYNIKTVKQLEYDDDRKKNAFTIRESYQIDSIWQNSLDENQILANFYPYTISDAMYMPKKRKRTLPYQFNYPIMKSHEINVKLPEKWNITKDGYSIDSEAFYYNFEVRYKPSYNMLTLSHLLKIEDPVVKPEAYLGFYDNLKKFNNNRTFSITYPKSGLETASETSINWWDQMGQILFFITFIVGIWVATKVYKYDPEPKTETYFEENKRIGGWLFFVGIGLCISPFITLYTLFENNGILIDGSWMGYLNTASGSFNFPLGMLIFFEMITNTFLLAVTPVLIYLFFARRSSFPKLYVYIVIGLFTFLILDTFIVGYLIGSEIQENEISTLTKSFIRSTLISSYLLMSERVKETFVKRLR